MKDSVCIYSGSFDPMTNGHVWVIRQALQIFERVIVAIGENPNKKYWFSSQERLEMTREACRSACFLPDQSDRIQVEYFGQDYLFVFANTKRAQWVVRGVRNSIDFEYEKTVAAFNEESGLNTVFLMPPSKLSSVSSSFVRGLIGYRHWDQIVPDYVPFNVFEAIQKKSERAVA